MIDRTSIGSKAIALVPIAVVWLAWALVTELEWVDPWLLPTPGQVVESLVADRSELFTALGWTSLGAVSGFVFSAVIGITVAVGISLNPTAYRALLPYAVIFQTVPVIAVAPILVIWLGYGLPTVIASSFLASVFPVLSSTFAGLDLVDRSLVDLFRLYRASRPQVLFKLVLPSALPKIFIGLGIAAGLAVIGAIVGEFVGGSGLGSVVDSARTQQRIDKVFAAVFLACVLGAGFVNLIDRLGRRALRHWHPGQVSSSSSALW